MKKVVGKYDGNSRIRSIALFASSSIFEIKNNKTKVRKVLFLLISNFQILFIKIAKRINTPFEFKGEVEEYQRIHYHFVQEHPKPIAKKAK